MPNVDRRSAIGRHLGLLAPLLALTLVLVPASAASELRRGTDGVGDRIFPQAGNGGIDAEHYFLALDYDPATGRLDATIAAIETLDSCLGRILKPLFDARGTAIVTADHGNAEQMWDDQLNAPHTAHTSNPVPVILCGEPFRGRRLRDGTLRDVAPTMLRLLGMDTSPDMTGSPLIEE